MSHFFCFPSPIVTTIISNPAAFQRQVLRQLEVISLRQLQQGELLLTVSQLSDPSPDPQPTAAMIEAPFNTLEQLNEFDASLDESKKDTLVKPAWFGITIFGMWHGNCVCCFK